jgi:hypothetical protein
LSLQPRVEAAAEDVSEDTHETGLSGAVSAVSDGGLISHVRKQDVHAVMELERLEAVVA